MRHIPVLLEEVIESLNLAPGKNVIDCTTGDAGHSEEILKLTSPDGKLIAIDADPEALLRAKQYLYEFHDRVEFVRENFVHIKKIVAESSIDNVDGVLMDLGWSTPQFEERNRGFSFQNKQEPLDMRYGSTPDNPIYGLVHPTAADLLQELDEAQLQEIFQKYGEENLSKEIAAAIIEKRKETAIETVGDLVDIVIEAYRTKLNSTQEIPWIGGLHPATKVFQALRIVVNDELGVVERALPDAIDVLSPGGRLAVISFHSLEDRIVKHTFKARAVKGDIKILTKKPIVCSENEYEENPRARSAKLRVIEVL